MKINSDKLIDFILGVTGCGIIGASLENWVLGFGCGLVFLALCGRGYDEHRTR